MTMIYHQDLMKIIDNKNKSDFLTRASAMVIKRMPTTAKQQFGNVDDESEKREMLKMRMMKKMAIES